MEYAVNTLQALIPPALQAGLGPSTIDKIHQVHRNYRDFYGEKILSSGRSAFAALFEEALAASDDEAIDHEQLRCDLDHRIAEIGGQPSNRVRLTVDAFSLIKPPVSAAPPGAPPVVAVRGPYANSGLGGAECRLSHRL